jgi:predicted nucleotidyltransferase component of viral defense system
MKEKTNIAHSVGRKLLDISRQRNVDYNIVLIWYCLERFLYRLGKSEYSDKFILKGAMLFAVWTGQPLRATKDLDMTAYGKFNTNNLKSVFTEICSIDVENDGIVFDTDRISIAPIRENQEYQGQRIKLPVSLGNAKIRLQIDIGFGDAVKPAPVRIKYPSLLGFSTPQIRAYSKETVIAEKLHTMIVLGIANSRMKDFYDIWIMSKQFDFDGLHLIEAVTATFKRRKTDLPSELPLSLTEEFSRDDTVKKRWNAFINKIDTVGDKVSLNQVIDQIRDFLIQPLEYVQSGRTFDKKWLKGQWR